MSLNQLLLPNPKEWAKLNCQSLNASNLINSPVLQANLIFGVGGLLTIGATPYSPSAAQLLATNSFLWSLAGGLTINLPTNADLTAALTAAGIQNISFNQTFQFSVVNDSPYKAPDPITGLSTNDITIVAGANFAISGGSVIPPKQTRHYNVIYGSANTFVTG
jgi:hypothetical protein